MNKDASLQERLRQDDKKALEIVYLNNRSYIIKYFRSYKAILPQLEDIYQDSIIDLYQNFVTKQLVLEKSNIRSYLLAIVKYKIADLIKDQKLKYTLTSSSEYETEYEIIDNESIHRQQELLAKHYQFLGKKCQQLLTLFYYRGLTIKEIKEKANYKDENTVKSSKSRCLKQLKALINKSQHGVQ